MKKLFLSIYMAVLATSGFAHASFTDKLGVTITEKKPVGVYSLGVGSEVDLTFPNQPPVPGLFLGTLAQPSGTTIKEMFLDLKKTRVYLVQKGDVDWNFSGTAQPILVPYEQMGSTCASYAMFDYFIQLNFSQTSATSALEDSLSDEGGRTRLLASAMDGYYVERPDRTSILSVMNKIAKEVGQKCKMKIFDEPAKAIAFIKEHLDIGVPVLVAFNIGSDMVNSSYEVTDFGSMSIEDNRLWVPRERGQRDSGGHAIVLAASFYNGNRYKAVAVDSDWTNPRIWDVANYINSKTAMPELEFYTCH